MSDDATTLEIRCAKCGLLMGTVPGKGTTGATGAWCRDCWKVMFPGVPYPEEPPPENTIGTQMLKGLITGSINDISYAQMNRIVRALQRMSRGERDAPKLVAAVLTEELGAAKALEYLDKSLAAGLINKRDFEAMRASLILPLPREEIPRPVVARMSAELLETQTRLRGEVRRLRQTGSTAFKTPFKALDDDVKRLRRAWGV